MQGATPGQPRGPGKKNLKHHHDTIDSEIMIAEASESHALSSISHGCTQMGMMMMMMIYLV